MDEVRYGELLRYVVGKGRVGIVVPLYHVGITTFICKEGLGELK